MKMNCWKCERPLKELEPVYRHVSIGMVCTECEAAKSKTDAAKGLGLFLPRWLPARPCAHCQRPVFRDRERKGEIYFVCSNQCRQAVHNANYRRKHPRSRVEQRCGDCGETFRPSRRDAKFCSMACRQRAYRRAQRAA